MALKLLTFRNSTKIIAFKKNPNLQTVTMLCICSKNQNATKKWMTTGFLMAFCVTCKIETETVPVLVWVLWAAGMYPQGQPVLPGLPATFITSTEILFIWVFPRKNSSFLIILATTTQSIAARDGWDESPQILGIACPTPSELEIGKTDQCAVVSHKVRTTLDLQCQD